MLEELLSLTKPSRLRQRSLLSLSPTNRTVYWACLSAASTRVRLPVFTHLCDLPTSSTVTPTRQKTFFDNAKPSLTSPVFTADLKYHAPGLYHSSYLPILHFRPMFIRYLRLRHHKSVQVHWRYQLLQRHYFQGILGAHRIRVCC